MSVATVPVQQATIRQYAKQLQLATVRGQFLSFFKLPNTTAERYQLTKTLNASLIAKSSAICQVKAALDYVRSSGANALPLPPEVIGQ